jgi:drug/metabolite transporter (DMT)-like permease
LVGVVSAVCSGIAVTAIRAARQTESSWSIYAAFCALGLLTTIPQAVMMWKTPRGAEWWWLMATALFAIAAQLLMTFALRWVDAMTSGVISQLVIVSMVCGAIILDERITPLVALGSALTIGGVCGVVYFTSLGRPLTAADEVAPES